METIIFESKGLKKDTKLKQLCDRKKLPVVVIDIDTEGICEELLLVLLKNSTLGLKDIVRKPQKKDEREMYDKIMDDENHQPLSEVVAYLSENPQLIRRPIMIQERVERRNCRQYYVSEIGSAAVEDFLQKF